MTEANLIEGLGYAAAGLVLATFSVRSLTTLRSLAIASNLLFIAYALCAGLPPVLLLHALLLPLNVVRLRQARRQPQQPAHARCGLCTARGGRSAVGRSVDPGIICTDNSKDRAPCLRT